MQSIGVPGAGLERHTYKKHYPDGAEAPSELINDELNCVPYWSSRSTEFGVALACASIAVPDWTKMLAFA